MNNVQKNPIRSTWHKIVAGLAVAGGSIASSSIDSFGNISGGYRRLQQTPGPGTALTAAPPAGGARLTVAPARAGMPPMLAINGQTTSLVGVNLSPPGNVSCGIPGVDFDAGLDFVKNSGGANTVRTWAFQATNPGGDWSSMDHAVAATQARNMILTVALANQWGDCEPRVNDLRPFKTLAWYQGGYKQPQSGDLLSYRDYVQAFATRYAGNSHLHIQLLNEALAGDLKSPGQDDSAWTCTDEDIAATAIQSFTSDIVGVIRAAAPHAVIALGTRGELGDCGLSTPEHFQAAAALVDVCELHSYDAAPTVVASRLQDCQSVGKPIIMGESAASTIDSATALFAQNPDFIDVSQVYKLQAQTLVNRLSNYTEGGLGGMLFWHYQTPKEQQDEYGLNASHPIYPMLTAIDKRALAGSSSNYNSFSTIAAALMPSPPPPPTPPPPSAPRALSAGDATAPQSIVVVQGPAIAWLCPQDELTRITASNLPNLAKLPISTTCASQTKTGDTTWEASCNVAGTPVPITLVACPAFPQG